MNLLPCLPPASEMPATYTPLPERDYACLLLLLLHSIVVRGRRGEEAPYLPSCYLPLRGSVCVWPGMGVVLCSGGDWGGHTFCNPAFPSIPCLLPACYGEIPAYGRTEEAMQRNCDIRGGEPGDACAMPHSYLLWPCLACMPMLGRNRCTAGEVLPLQLCPLYMMIIERKCPAYCLPARNTCLYV